MLDRPRRPPAAAVRDRDHRPAARRVTAALVLTALAAFGIVASITVLVSKRIARDDALAEALRTAENIAAILFAPAMPAVLLGDQAAVAKLDAAVALPRRSGLIVRVKVWTRDGTVVYSDTKEAVGRRYPLDADVRATIDSGTRTADISNLTAAENVTETGVANRLVEVYTPLDLADGRRLAFELYMSDNTVRAAEHRLIVRTVPLALLSLLVLVIIQLPVSVWLVRRVGRANAERAALLQQVLTVSENERRSVAHDLHDGAVQELAGANFALGSLTARLPAGADPEAAGLLDRVSSAVQKAMGSLRTLIVDIYPPDLSVKGMAGAFEDLAKPLRDAGLEVRIDVEPGAAAASTSTDVAALLYRCARECLINVSKHAQAGQASITLVAVDRLLVLTIDDDGAGLPPTGIDTRRDGHFGLRLLRDAVAGMGGRLLASTSPLGGTRIVVELPGDSSARL